MRLLSSFVGIVLLTAGTAQAQDWSGFYAGTNITWQESQDGDVKSAVRVLRDPRLVYSTSPAAQEYVGPSFDSAAVGGVFGGWRTEVGRVVLGVEAQVQAGRSEVRFDSGVLSYSSSASGAYTACGEASLGCLSAFDDSAAGRVEIDSTVAVRTSLGFAVGERVLVSAYSGPSVAFSSLMLAQRSQLFITRPGTIGPDCIRVVLCSLPTLTSAPNLTTARSEDDSALGFVGGLTLDVKVSETVLARAEVGYARYEAFRLEGDATQTSLAAQHVAITGSLGLIVRF